MTDSAVLDGDVDVVSSKPARAFKYFSTFTHLPAKLIDFL